LAIVRGKLDPGAGGVRCVKRKDKSTVINFRLSPSLARSLVQAAGRVNMSPGAYARLLVVEALADADRVRLFDEVAAIRRGVVTANQNLEAAAVAILVDGGKAEPEEAAQFVRDNFRRAG